MKPYTRLINAIEMQVALPSEINSAVNLCHGLAKEAGWWDGANTASPDFIPAKLCLIHSEVSEAMEGARKNLMDDHLPERLMLEVELADAVIRIMDLAGGLDLDLGGAIAEKLLYNTERNDHKPENRAGVNGKVF